LSPHYDDICFSLGMTAKTGDGGHLVNIFTQCNYTAAPGPSSTDEVTKIRDTEDSRFAAQCKLTRHALGLPEATVLGLNPFDLENIQQEVERLEKPLTDLIFAIAEEAPETEIYCPLAVGRHRNHISVFLTIIKAYGALRKKSRIFFYEDLPYASHPGARDEALKRLAYYFPPSNLARHVHQLTHSEFDEKIELVSLYKSQHSGPAAANRFIPADPQAPFPHEAFWEVRS
jgi:hypothetical protein